MPIFEKPGAAMARMRHEAKLRTDAVLAEREARRLAEVRAAFFEGMAAGDDAWWQERPPEDYWLESDARCALYAGPPKPDDPSKRAVLAMKNRRAPYDRTRESRPRHRRLFLAGRKAAKMNSNDYGFERQPLCWTPKTHLRGGSDQRGRMRCGLSQSSDGRAPLPMTDDLAEVTCGACRNYATKGRNNDCR